MLVCPEDTFCAPRFGDGVCDPECDTVDCLRDGDDCRAGGGAPAYSMVVEIFVLGAVSTIRFRRGLEAMFHAPVLVLDDTGNSNSSSSTRIERRARRSGDTLWSSSSSTVLVGVSTECFDSGSPNCFQSASPLVSFLNAQAGSPAAAAALGVQLLGASSTQGSHGTSLTTGQSIAAAAGLLTLAIAVVLGVVSARASHARRKRHARGDRGAITRTPADGADREDNGAAMDPGPDDEPLAAEPPSKMFRPNRVGPMPPGGEEMVPQAWKSLRQLADGLVNETEFASQGAMAQPEPGTAPRSTFFFPPLSPDTQRSLHTEQSPTDCVPDVSSSEPWSNALTPPNDAAMPAVGSPATSISMASAQPSAEADGQDLPSPQLLPAAHLSPQQLFFTAALTGHMQTLLRVQPEDISLQDEAGDTALHFACRRSHHHVIRYLLDQGASTAVLNALGNSPLHDSVHAGDVLGLELLLSSGVSPDQPSLMGLTPLMLAIIHQHPVCLRALQHHGASIALADKNGWRAVHWAAAVNDVIALEALIQQGADINVQNNRRETPLMISARENNEQVVYMLLKHAAKRSPEDQLGRTALDLASKRNHARIVELLLDWSFGKAPGRPLPPSPPSSSSSPKSKPPLARRTAAGPASPAHMSTRPSPVAATSFSSSSWLEDIGDLDAALALPGLVDLMEDPSSVHDSLEDSISSFMPMSSPNSSQAWSSPAQPDSSMHLASNARDETHV